MTASWTGARQMIAGIAAAVIIALVLPPAAAHTQLIAEDGDSLLYAGGVSMRLLCIDAPEFGQPGSDAARNALNALLTDNIRLRQRGADQYRRLLVIADTVVNGKKLNINTEMVRQGHAWVYRRFANTCGLPRVVLCAAEAEAQAQKRGLWRDDALVPPWRWRRNSRRAGIPPCITDN